MSRILRRPMFRGGRVARAGGGLSQLRQGYAFGDEVMDIYSQVQEKIPMPEKAKRKGERGETSRRKESQRGS